MQPQAVCARMAFINYLADMRKFLLTLAVAGFAFSNLSAQTQSSSPENLLVEIGADMSREDLAELQKELREAGVGFRYDNIEWAEGELKTIRLAIRCEDGTIGISDIIQVSADAPARFGISYVEGKPQICFAEHCD